MRFLHTSDWHLGRRFHGEDLIPAQHEFLDHLLTVAVDERVDAVLVAGDIYDRAIPSLDAVGLFDDVLDRFADLQIPVVMISGNHDSPRRLGVGSRVLSRAGIHLRTDPADLATPILLDDDHGPVAVYGVPYLEPVLASTALAAPHATHEAVLQAALNRIRANLATRPPTTRSIVLAHAFITNAAPCDSERALTIGGVPTVPAAVFEGIDYVALGHLHRPQQITPRLRYSGSPLAYSFSEADQDKSMWLIDLAPDATVTGKLIAFPTPRPLARLTGRLPDLLADPHQDHLRDAWLHITLTDPVRPHEPMARLRHRFPHLVKLAYAPDASPGQNDPGTYRARLRGRTDLQILLDFVHHTRSTAADQAEQDLLAKAVESVRLEHAAKETP